MAIPMDNSWCFSTNWMISGASRPTAVNCVSSPDSRTVSDEPATTGRRTPLILKSSSSSSYSPCDIKICFMQRHRIKKIYVRSTARTYEVYYTPELESKDLYLCTVGCDATSREEDVLPTSDNKENREAISENSKVSNEETASESVSDSAKDQWVVLGIPASPPDQDFYEAAIKTNDAEPCISVTLRLLSPHSKVLILIDEVRVFADALEPSDPEYKRHTVSRSLFVRFFEDEHASSKVDEHASSKVDEQGTRSDIPCLTETSSESEPIINMEDEKVLEQLLLKMCKIEDLFSTFEKNMEARLQRVEQHMEFLAKKSKCPAPLMTESNWSTFYDSEKEHSSCSTADDTSTSSSGSPFVSNLVVTAPAFSFDEDENKEDIWISERPKGGFAAAATNIGFPRATFGRGYNLSRRSGALSNGQGSNAFGIP